MSKINIWKQLELVIENDCLTLKQKEYLISNLRRIIIIKSDKDTFEINKEILGSIKSIIEKYQQDFFETIESEIVESGRKWVNKMPILVKDAVYIIVIVLIASLNTNTYASTNVLITHLTFYLVKVREYKKYNILTDIDYDKLNEIFIDTINLDLQISQVKVKNMTKLEQSTWKFVNSLIKILIEKGFLEKASTIDYRPTELHKGYKIDERDIINWKSGRNRGNKKPYPVNIISLANSIKENSAEFSSFFFSEWPQLVPEELEDMTDECHSQLRKGVSMMVMKKPLKQYLFKMSKVGLKFNYNLLLEAEANINHKLFNEHKIRSHNESVTIAYSSSVEYKSNLFKIQNISKLQSIRSIVDYFDSTSANYKGWIITILEKELMKKERKLNKDAYNSIYTLLSNFEKISTNKIEDTMRCFFIYILEKLNIRIHLEQQKEDLYLGFRDSISLLSAEVIDEEYINIIISVISYLGLSKLSNFRYIAELYPQNPVNIFDIYAERIFSEKDLSKDEKDIISKNNKLYIKIYRTSSQ